MVAILIYCYLRVTITEPFRTILPLFSHALLCYLAVKREEGRGFTCIFGPRKPATSQERTSQEVSNLV